MFRSRVSFRQTNKVSAQPLPGVDVGMGNWFGSEPETFSTARYAKTLHSQGLIIHDEDDPVIPYSDALLIQSNFKNSALITTKGFGHSLNHKNVTLHISEFIEN